MMNRQGSDNPPPIRPGDLRPEFLSRMLGPSANCPDLTRSIMGRLGFMQVPPRVVRRDRIRRRISRTLFTLAMASVIFAAFQLHQNSPQSRRPEGPTLPAAIGSGLNHQQNGLSSVIRAIRSLAPPVAEQPDSVAPPQAPPDPGPPQLHEDIDRSAIAPVRWV